MYQVSSIKDKVSGIKYQVLTIIILFLFIALFSFVSATSKDDIVFPVAELGNCQSEETCRTYCDNPANMNVCLDFAQQHNLISEEELSRGHQFAEVLAAGGGPAGCQTPGECEAYCSDIIHIDECLSFAEEHGFEVPEAEEARKIRDYLASGGQMPGGCTTRESCETYCSDFNNFETCFAFAETVGLEVGDGDKEFSRDQMRRMLELMRQGRTPGGCRSESQCEAYCSNEGNIEECINFGIEVGFISSEEAEIFRKTGGKGPGGCSGREECETFCNDPANQEACFAFAQEHGLISEEDLGHIREGVNQLKLVLDEAPPEVVECLQNSLGTNIIDQIRAGTLTPGPEIGEKVKVCFETHFDGGEFFANIPPEVRSCVEGRLGGSLEDLMRSGSPSQMEGAFQECFQAQGGGPGFGGEGGFGEGGHPPTPDSFGGGEAVDVSDLPVGLRGIEGIENILREVPPELRTCVAEKLNERGVSPDVVYVGIQECSQSLTPPAEAPPQEPPADSSQQYQEEYQRQYEEQYEQQYQQQPQEQPPAETEHQSLGEFFVAALGLLFGIGR